MSRRFNLLGSGLVMVLVLTGCLPLDTDPPPVIPPPPPPTTECPISGYDFGPYVYPGQNPDWGTVVSREQIQDLLAIVAPTCTWIRTFGSDHGLEWVPLEAKNFGNKTAVGAWINTNEATNQIQIDAAVEIANAGNADILIIGSETLLRRDQTDSQLAALILGVKARVSVPVTTADPPSELLAAPQTMAACDKLLVNIYPYWEGKSIDEALDYLNQSYEEVVAVAGGKEVIISETGWPSGGNAVGLAVPSPENAAFYFQNFVAWARAKDVTFFYFAAFDGPWKVGEGPQGTQWGTYTSEGVLKPGMETVFNCE